MALLIETRVSGIWQTNSTVVSQNGEVLVVDPAFFPRELDELASLAAQRGTRVTIAFTHGHWDHVAGWRHFPAARVMGSATLSAAVAGDSAAARRNLDQLREFDGRWYVAREAPPAFPPVVAPLADGQRFEVGGAEVEALALPGHSADGLALLVATEGLLLPGDHLSPCEIPFVEDLARYRATLHRLLKLLPGLKRVIPGHGRALTAREAVAIAEADLAYLDALAAAAAAGDAAAALTLALPRAEDVPGMREHHLENCAAAGLRMP